MSKKQLGNTEGANAVGHNNVITATATAIYDIFSNKGQIPPLDPNIDMSGKTCLVTGANTGLGFAIAKDLARKGAYVIMACRSGHPDAGEAVKKESGSNLVEMIRVDLSDLHSIDEMCQHLSQRKLHIDVLIANAGLMPLNGRKSAQDYELMFAVHFLANRYLCQRFLDDGLIKGNKDNTPRIIFVSSEAHQSSSPINFNTFGEFEDFGIKDGMKYYAKSKLQLCTFANELSRRLNPDPANINIAVHSLCPGPIASSIARESPSYLKPIIVPIMKLLFRSPEQAAEPVIYLACEPSIDKRTGIYLHMMREKTTSTEASSEKNGQLLWEKSLALLEKHQQTRQTSTG